MKKILLLLFVPKICFAAFVPESFVANYDGFYNNKKVGVLEKKVSFEKSGNYEIHSSSKANGFYGFLPVSDYRIEYSKGVYSNEKLTPILYSMDRTGTWIDFKMTSVFDLKKNELVMTYKDKSKTVPINQTNILDNASFQIQFQIDADKKQNIKYVMAYKTGLKDYTFNYDGESVIKTVLNDKTKVLKYIEYKGKNKKNISVIWFAPDYNNILVKLEVRNKKGEELALFNLRELKPL